ncbi:hypothetical protein [Paraprevotella xylaniphila]|uniref:hypothetical protein n=1 Tax=Paraprevotella xylaniphila TaxID=454155 RepID=UPI0026DAAA85|nr:hypothetical protein [Paraprevotella xylaniphila]
MRGFIVKSSTWGNEVCRVGMEGEHSIGIDFNVGRSGEAYWGVGGFKMPEECHWIWKGGALSVGDVVELEFADFKEATPPVAIEPHTCSLVNDDKMNPETVQVLLEEYESLKRLLEQAGIMGKDI